MNIKKNLFIFVLSSLLLSASEAYADGNPDYLREATGLAGAGTGAAIGIEVGTALGGPPGAALGGLIGGVAGGVASYYSYDKLNKKYIYPLTGF